MGAPVIFPHTVTIVRPASGVDGYGDPSEDWGQTTSTWSAAWVQPRSTSEVNGGRTAVLTEWMAFLPEDAPIAAGDRLVWEGRTYEVDGEPAVLWNPSGPHHVEASLKRITG